MLTQPVALPVTLDTREGLLIQKTSSPNLCGVRSREGGLITSPGAEVYATVTPATNFIRSFQYCFLDDGIHAYKQGTLILTEQHAYFQDDTNGTFNDLLQTYSWNAVSGRYLRYATVNTLGYGAFTALNNGYTGAAQYLRVRILDGSLGVVTIPSDYGGEHMIAFNNRLLIGYTGEAGVLHPARVRWCVNGNFQDWTGIGSGFIDVANYYPGRAILGFMQLSGRAYLSLDREIIEIVPTGTTAPAFTLESRVLGSGMSVGQTWAATEYFGFYLGNDAVVYRWDGANLTDISQPIAHALQLALTPTPRRKSGVVRWVAQGAINLNTQEYWLLPDDGTDIFIYDYRRGRWYRDTYPQLIKGIGTFFRSAYSDDSSMILGGNDSVVTRSSMDVTAYNTVAMPRVVETPDYTAQEIRAGQLLPTLSWRNSIYALRFRSRVIAPLEVGYSLNQGATWTTQTITPNADGEAVMWILVDFSRIRFRFKTIGNTAFDLADLISYDWEKNGPQL